MSSKRKDERQKQWEKIEQRFPIGGYASPRKARNKIHFLSANGEVQERDVLPRLRRSKNILLAAESTTPPHEEHEASRRRGEDRFGGMSDDAAKMYLDAEVFLQGKNAEECAVRTGMSRKHPPLSRREGATRRDLPLTSPGRENLPASPFSSDESVSVAEKGTENEDSFNSCNLRERYISKLGKAARDRRPGSEPVSPPSLTEVKSPSPSLELPAPELREKTKKKYERFFKQRFIRRLSAWFSKNPVRLVLVSFLAVISFGALLLSLPFASRSGHSVGLFTAFFTATSSTCVTGLVLVDTMTAWSAFGQAVILLLIQIGGLSLLTLLSAVGIGLKHRITFRTTRALQDGTGSSGLGETLKLLGKIIKITFTIEVLGAVGLSLRYMRYMSPAAAVWKGSFQSVSSFCNAGFDLMGDFSGPFSSLTAFRRDPVVLLITAALIISGGLGFVVWTDLLSVFRRKKLRFHSKLMLFGTVSLLLVGTLYFFFSESRHATAEWSELTLPQQWMNAFFQSTTARTAGFNSLDQSTLSDGSKWFTSILMIIGAGPASTGGGIKVTSFFLLLAGAYADLRGRSGETQLFKHRVVGELVRRSSSLLILALGITFGLSLFIYFTLPPAFYPRFSFTDIYFESVSAFGTVGLSSAGTAQLSTSAHVGLILAMYIGRVGPASLALSLVTPHNKGAAKVLPDGRTFVG